MRRVLLSLALVGLVGTSVQASILTNTNQSVPYIRLLSRNATTDVDAVYYNPAGTAFLKDGWHFSLANQFIFQDKTITNDFALLNERKYVGEVRAMLFPDLYAVYKKDRLAISFGFGPNSGGGSADYKTGLPSFETDIATIPLLLTSKGITTPDYSAKINFEGTSVFYGFQLNVSYAVTDTVSLAAGARYIYAKNTYKGAITDIMINPQNPYLNPGLGMTSASLFFAKLAKLDPRYAYYAGATADMAVDAEQTGSGFTPILGLHVRPLDNLNLAVRYEFKTKLELTNKTARDDVGLFPNGEKTRSDLPAILALGAEYGLLPNLRASLSMHYFFDKDVNWDYPGNRNLIAHNSWDLGLGLEYDVNSMFRLSGGVLRTSMGINKDYQTDLRHELSSTTVGFGGRVTLSDKLSFDIAGLNVFYEEASKMIPYLPPLSVLGSYEETFKRTSFVISAGFNINF